MQLSIQRIIEIASKVISIVGHPVFIPVYTVYLYFYLSSRYFLPQNRNFLLIYLFIVTIIIPVLFLAIFYVTKTISGINLYKPRERLFFSSIMAVVYFIVFQKLIKHHQFIELYPFFLGIFLSILVLALYNFFKQKPSIHSMAVAGSLTFLTIWSYYTQINILNYLVLLILIASLIIASRLYLKAHNLTEIFRGLIIGALMQMIAFYLSLIFF